MVTKNKREHKLRGKEIKSNGPDSVGDKANHGVEVSKHQVSGNRFSSLKIQDSGNGAAQPFSFGKQDQDSVGPSSNGSGPQKILTRNKRPRKEPVFVQPKIFGDEKYKPLLKGMNQGSDPKAHQERRLATHKTIGSESPKELPSTSTTKAQVKDFQGGICTLMEVEYVGPNRLRFVDEPKAPDPLCPQPNALSCPDRVEAGVPRSVGQQRDEMTSQESME
ncbi:hypothetical protein SESBI_25649 [Sesbania bispinosa]|nr:hypothetical protein SESBI_25649 [Sesbania bispinosa]